ncbi:hypothetical protein ACOMHN_045751 [Nucella lapillus]
MPCIWGIYQWLCCSKVCAFRCAGVPDGVYEESCKTFILCVNGSATLTECHFGTVSNGGNIHNISCVKEDTVEPPCGMMRDCTHLANGRYADVATNCTSYFTCHNSYYYGHNYCSGGLVFDETMGLCNWPNPAQPCFTNAPNRAIVG